MLALIVASVAISLQPQASDAILNEVRAKWQGKKVWVLGASCYSKNGTETWNPNLPAIVKSVERSTSRERNISATWGDNWAVEAIPRSDYRLNLQLPAMPFHREHIATDDAGPTYNPPFYGEPIAGWQATENGKTTSSFDPPKRAAATGWLYFGTIDELQHQITTTPANSLLAKESKTIRRQFGRHRVVKGMTRALVARIIGFPSVRVPLSDLWQSRKWVYEGVAPFAVECSFDDRGRVAVIEMTGSLPGTFLP